MDKLRTAIDILNARTDFGLDTFLIVGDITDMAGHLLDDTEIKLFKQVIEEKTRNRDINPVRSEIMI